MTGIQLFGFNGLEIRVVMIDGNPWFVAKDVCKVLDMGNVSQSITRLKEYECRVIIINDSVGRNQDMVIISESGLYRLVLTSRKPQAEPFQDWVVQSVLPSIRKTGSYTTEKKVNIYARRVQIASNWNIPKGHFCVFHEMSLLANKVGEKYDVGEYDLIDGSVGKCWSGYRKDKEWALPTTKFHIFFGDKRDLAYPEATAYQLEELTYFRKWLEDIYQFENMPRYLATKYKDLIKV